MGKADKGMQSLKWAERYIRNYPINLIDARHIEEKQLEQFEGDLKAFFCMLSERYNVDKLKGIVAKHRETWYAISAVKNDTRYLDYINSVSDEELDGGIHMDATLNYIEAKGTKKTKNI